MFDSQSRHISCNGTLRDPICQRPVIAEKVLSKVYFIDKRSPKPLFIALNSSTVTFLKSSSQQNITEDVMNKNSLYNNQE
ncbi:hypothetical protein SNE40_000241 [Patella caerulea]|uniref:Uncharacterized protein n=1 Tax=Patella caerulea TaxID=87958 RepID=A0AAN8KKR2_PATCE